MRRRPFNLVSSALAVLLLGSCGGGGGGGSGGDPVDPDGPIGVFSGVAAGFNFDWEGGGGDGGVGGGGDGDGGVGAGGDFGQFRNALVRAYKQDGTLIGEAPTDEVNGMVTIKPGRTYSGSLCVELIGGVHGGRQATYYEEGRDAFVPFPAGKTIRVRVARIDKNIGLTALTEAAYRHLHGGANADCRTSVTPAQIRASNEVVRKVLNQQFPKALEVDDITRLPHIKSKSLPQGTISTDPRGRYGLVNGALSKQAAMFAAARTAPTLDLLEQIAEDLIDGQLDGRRGLAPAVPAEARTYEPNTFTGELSSALAQQATRFGSQEALDALPPVLNFGNLRYEGYLFDGSISKDGKGYSTVSGWVAGNELDRKLGQPEDKFADAGLNLRAFSLFANHGHGGGFYKTDSTGVPRVFAFGDNVSGELGNGDADAHADLVEITGKLPAPLTHAAGGFSHTVARLADGSVWAWGDNSFGQLGVAPATLPRALAPRRVALAQGALAVAATSVASYALMEDGSVVAWGSNGGFGLLGNGVASGTVATPAAVNGLSDVVQIAARDNDVVVLKRDNTVWTWGSFPADTTAFVPGDPTQAYEGGRLVPTRVAGLPTTRQVRKVLTEQGLFVALLDNGHVYTWGVYFDLTADAVLRDVSALRILGVPPLRDLMPGGFNGYGVRAFDRMTAMGIDYRGGMWKLRGRVAEQFDPANPAQQRRPRVQSPRPDCVNCHLFLNDWPLVPDPPTSSAVCDPYGTRPDIHGTRGSGSLIHRDTECQQCHNPARNPPIAAFPNGWLTCVRPTDLPRRPALVDPPLITNACTIPAGHVFTPPGTVCASCHNGVIAEPLNEKEPPCAQPRPSELPTIATTVAISGAFADGNVPIAGGSLTGDNSPELRGTVSAALGTGQTVRVLRNGSPAGTATRSGTNWAFTDSVDVPGTYTYTARVEASGGGFGPTSNAITFSIDAVAPTVVADVTGVTDDALGTIDDGSFLSDTTPRISGTLGAALAAGERIELQRDGQFVARFSTAGTAWSYTETSPLSTGAHTWRARVVDSAGNAADFGGTRSATIVSSVPTASITTVTGVRGAVIADGGFTTSRTPTVNGSVAGTLPAGYVVRVLRNGTSATTLTPSGTAWSFTEPSNLADGAYAYTARVEAGKVLGAASAAYTVNVDATAPAQTANVTSISDDVADLPDGGSTADTTPTVSGTLSAALAAGESVRVTRTGPSGGSFAAQTTGTTWVYGEEEALGEGTYTYSAAVVDAAGNVGAQVGTTRSVVIDLSAVSIPNKAAVITAVNGIAPSANAIPVSADSTPTLAGTIASALAGDERLRVYRDNVAVGVGVVSGTDWTFADGTLADATYGYRARVEKTANANLFGVASATIAVPIDTAAPTQTAAVTAITDGSTAFANNGFTTDTTPLVQGTLSATLGAGEQLQVLREGVVVNTQTPAGTTWSFQETSALVGANSSGTFTYAARVRDAAGNTGATSTTRTINVVTNLPATTITSINGSASNPLTTNDTTPQINLTLSASLPSGYVVRVLRNGTPLAGALSACAPSCAFVDAVSTNQTYNYTARTEAGGSASVVGTAIGTNSNTRSMVLDTVAPSQTISMSASSSVAPNTTLAGAIPPSAAISDNGTTNDPTPLLRLQLNAALGSGEAIQVFRGGVQVFPSLSSCGTNCFQFLHPATVSITTPPTAPSAGNPIGSTSYTARIVDAAGNAGSTFPSPTNAFDIVFNYFSCSQVRANTTFGGTHATISAGANPALRCSGCHSNVSPADPADQRLGTPAGSLVGVPVTNPSYWCRRPG